MYARCWHIRPGNNRQGHSLGSTNAATVERKPLPTSAHTESVSLQYRAVAVTIVIPITESTTMYTRTHFNHRCPARSGDVDGALGILPTVLVAQVPVTANNVRKETNLASTPVQLSAPQSSVPGSKYIPALSRPTMETKYEKNRVHWIRKGHKKRGGGRALTNEWGHCTTYQTVIPSLRAMIGARLAIMIHWAPSDPLNN